MIRKKDHGVFLNSFYIGIDKVLLSKTIKDITVLPYTHNKFEMVYKVYIGLIVFMILPNTITSQYSIKMFLDTEGLNPR